MKMGKKPTGVALPCCNPGFSREHIQHPDGHEAPPRWEFSVPPFLFSDFFFQLTQIRALPSGIWVGFGGTIHSGRVWGAKDLNGRRGALIDRRLLK